MLSRIAYISTSESGIAKSFVLRLLMECCLHNRRDGITGMLFADGRRFVQIIEGPAIVVHHLWERLQNDPRHHSIVQIMNEPSTLERLYPNRSMGYTELSARELDDLIDEALTPLMGATSSESWVQQAQLLARIRGFSPAESEDDIDRASQSVNAA